MTQKSMEEIHAGVAKVKKENERTWGQIFAGLIGGLVVYVLFKVLGDMYIWHFYG